MSRDTAYYPNKLWVCTETGAYSSMKPHQTAFARQTLVILNLDTWSNEDVYAWENMTDSERQDYARVVMEANEQTATPLEYMKQEAEYRAGLR